MQVAIQTTRYYATLSKKIFYFFGLYHHKIINNIKIAMQFFKVLLIKINLSFYVWRVVSEDFSFFKEIFPADCFINKIFSDLIFIKSLFSHENNFLLINFENFQHIAKFNEALILMYNSIKNWTNRKFIFSIFMN